VGANSNTRTNTPTQVPALPAIPAGASPELRKYLETLSQVVSIRLGRRGDPRDRAVTLRELIDGGLAKEFSSAPFDPNRNGNGGFASPQALLADLAVPPAPTGFTASGAYSQINLNWDYPAYSNHSHTEVHVHTSNVIGDATLLGIQTGRVLVDPVGSGQTRYYWVRHVNTDGLAGPFNSASGTAASTAADASHLLSVLSGAITSSQLTTDLSTEITDATSNVTALQNTYGSTAAAATSAASAANAQAAALLAQQGAETAESNAETAETNAETAQAAASNSASSAASSATGALGSAATAESHKNTAATASSNAAGSAAAANSSSQAAAASATAAGTSATASDTAKTAAETAKSSAESSKNSAATSASSATSSAAAAQSSASTAATAAGQAGTSATAANTSAQAAAASATTAGTSATAATTAKTAAETAKSNAEASASSAASSATAANGSATAAASTVSGLTARLNDVNNTGSGSAVTVEQAYSVTASNAGDITNLEGQYTVKIDNNGNVAGFGLANTTTAAGTSSEFTVVADRFSLVSGSDTLKTVPFAVQATATTINGQSVPAGVYMDNAFIKNGSIESAKIGTLAADKITSGFIDADRIEANSVEASKLILDNSTITSQNISGIPTVIIKNLGVDTLQIKDQAVTFPVVSQNTQNRSRTSLVGGLSMASLGSADSNGYYTLSSLTHVATGAPIEILATYSALGFQNSYNAKARIFRGSTELYVTSWEAHWTPQGYSVHGPFVIRDTPAAGTYTYSLKIEFGSALGGFRNYGSGTSYNEIITRSFIRTLETKK